MRAPYESVVFLYGSSWVFTDGGIPRTFVPSKTQFKSFVSQAARLGSGQRDLCPGGQPLNSIPSFLKLPS